MAEPIIDVQPNRTWNNWHATHGVGGPVARFYTPHNAWSDGTELVDRKFAPGLDALQRIVREAEADKKRVRAVGSGWSLNSAGFVDDYLVNTARLSSWFLGFKTPTLVEPAMRSAASRLVFAQCGTQIKTLNTYLEAAGLALPTSGASNGQTIVGAMSTGTHGSAHDVGAIQDYILGLHVVAEGGTHYWIERPSKPTMTKAFADWLGATFVRDEDLFLSAVVGFGSFGLIHAVMFEAVPLYLLELYVRQFDFTDVIDAACTRSPAGLDLPGGAAMPFHLEFVLNPYLRGAGEGGAFVRALYRRDLVGPPPPPPPMDAFDILSQDLVAIAGFLSDTVPAIVPSFLQSQLLRAVRPTAPGTVLATPGIQFGDTMPTNGGTSIEIGVPLDRTRDALYAIFSVVDVKLFGAPVALRYLKSSDALLAPTCHQPTTCTIEMPGVDSQAAADGHARIFAALSAKGVPATYHWGQQSPGTLEAIEAGFGQQRVKRWLDARRGFLSTAGRRTFSNAFLDACGLSS